MHVIDLGYKEWITYPEGTLMLRNITDNTYKCKCGHTELITNKEKKKICSYCGNYIYRDKNLEFKNKMMEVLKK